MDYMSVTQAAELWGISSRRIRVLCAQGKIDGVLQNGRAYQIPIGSHKPADGRKTKDMTIPSDFANQFAKIDAMKQDLARRRPFTQGELDRIRETFLIEFTYNSNAIEGNTLTLQETALVLEGITIDQKPLKDHLEVIGHRDAFLYVQQLISNKDKITDWVIKSIHSLVLIDRPDDRGCYRRIPVKIVGAFHEPAQPYLVPVQMEQLISEFEKVKIHPLERVALFHLKFEGIHPFIDGNGRIGRLLMNFQLMQAGFSPINVKFTDRQRYYACFDSYYRDNNAAPMIKMVSDYVEGELRSLMEAIRF